VRTAAVWCCLGVMCGIDAGWMDRAWHKDSILGFGLLGGLVDESPPGYEGSL